MDLQNFSEVPTRAGCGDTIYLGITREASNIFYGLTLLLQVLCLITNNLVELKRENPDPILKVRRIEWREIIDFLV